MAEQRLGAVRRAALVSLAATSLVVVAKLAAASYSHSVSVLAEGAQSTVDVVVSLAAIVTVTLAAKPPDDDHPYGHGRLEVLTGAAQRVIVVLTAAMIAWQATARLHTPEPVEADVGIVVMVAAVASNMLVRAYLNRTADKHGSGRRWKNWGLWRLRTTIAAAGQSRFPDGHSRCR
jgi:cation diffusion facilitator family transporter